MSASPPPNDDPTNHVVNPGDEAEEHGAGAEQGTLTRLNYVLLDV